MRLLAIVLLLVFLIASCALPSVTASPRGARRRLGRTGLQEMRLQPSGEAVERIPRQSADSPPTPVSRPFPRLLSGVAGVDASSASNYTHCNACVALSSYIAPLVENDVSLSVIETLAVAYCVATEAEGECSGPLNCLALCKGIIGDWGAIIVGIYLNSSLSAQAVCFDLGECPAPAPPSPIPGVPVPSNVSDMSGQKAWPAWSRTSGSGVILHLTDLHYDVLYTAGSLARCPLPLCCRDGTGTNGSDAAGLFGDFNCDSSPLLVSTLFDFLNASLVQRPDLILYTGDDPAHDVWAQTRASNLRAVQWVSSELQRFFPDVPVLSAIGNHESCPVNLFAGPGRDAWLYSALVQYWSYYLPHDAQQTLNYGGYYAALARPGLYVVSINTNIYTSDDAYVDPKDPIDLSSQLNWFNDTMGQIARLGARAVVIGHSSPVDWYPHFSSAFNALLDAHSASILNLFFGHTHHNQVQMYHSPSSPVPHTVGYIGGSVTPYTDTNPGFSLYSYDRALPSAFLVSDIELHWLNLSDANARAHADWSAARLRATADYGLSDLSPASWFKLAETMRQGGAGVEYERMQTARNKGAYSGGQGTQRDRQGLACEMENDTDEDARRCAQRSAGTADAAVRSEERIRLPHLPDCLSDSDPEQAQQMDAERMRRFTELSAQRRWTHA